MLRCMQSTSLYFMSDHQRFGTLDARSSILFSAHEPIFSNKKVLMLEAGEKKEMKSLPEKYFSRTCALSPATKELLESK